MTWLDLRRLRYFRAICDAGSISEAARQISVPQPALSYHLKELEADFGGPLLNRSRSGVGLTEGGQLLLDHATIILAQVSRAEKELRALQRRGPDDPRIIRICSIPSVAPELTPRLLQNLSDLPQLAGVYVIEANTRESREMLSEGKADFAIIIADEKTPEEQYLASENMIFCMGADHPDREVGPITLAEALAEPLMLPAKGKPVRDLVERLAQQIGATVQITHEIDGPNPRKQATMVGLGRSFLPWIAIKDEVANGQMRYREVCAPSLARYVGLEWRERLDAEITEPMLKVLKSLLGTMLR
ncbi:MAG: LysR family transcriptional regulator [Geminicoccaceae bacterium]|nr:LysR family transcriptional regulator [Geminicoccaceae bacterium]